MLPKSGENSDAGATLVEVLVALAILSLGAVAILAGVELSVRGSDLQRKQANSGALVRSLAEAVQDEVSANGLGNCGSIGAVVTSAAASITLDGYEPSVANVQTWGGSGWVSCSGSSDGNGLQRVTLTVTSTDPSDKRQGSETLTITLRDPCSAELPDDSDGDDPCF